MVRRSMHAFFLIVLVVGALTQEALNPPSPVQVGFVGDTNLTGCNPGTITTFLQNPHWSTDFVIWNTSIAPNIAGDISASGVNVQIKVPYAPQKFRWYPYVIRPGVPDTFNTTNVTAYTPCNAVFTNYATPTWMGLQGDISVNPVNRNLMEQFNAPAFPYLGLSSPYWTVLGGGGGNCDTINYSYNISFADLTQCSSTDGVPYLKVANVTTADGSNTTAFQGLIMLVGAGYYLNMDTQLWEPKFERYYVPWEVRLNKGMAIVSTAPSNFLATVSTYAEADSAGTVYYCLSGLYEMSSPSPTTTVMVRMTPTSTPTWLTSAFESRTSGTSAGPDYYFSSCIQGYCAYGAANCSGIIDVEIAAYNWTAVPSVLLSRTKLQLKVPQMTNFVSMITRWKIGVTNIYKKLSNGTVYTPTVWQSGDRMNVNVTAQSISCPGAPTDPKCALHPSFFKVTIYRALLCIPTSAGVVPTIGADTNAVGCLSMTDYTYLVDFNDPTVGISYGNYYNYYKPTIISYNASASLSFDARLYMFSGTRGLLRQTSPVQYLQLQVDVTYLGQSKRENIMVALRTPQDPDTISSPSLYPLRLTDSTVPADDAEPTPEPTVDPSADPSTESSTESISSTEEGSWGFMDDEVEEEDKHKASIAEVVTLSVSGFFVIFLGSITLIWVVIRKKRDEDEDSVPLARAR
jgi:hypothetical protein